MKELGVENSKIKTNASNYSALYYQNEANDQVNYTLQLTVTATSKETAQKVQDYLLTTSPLGSVTPMPSFSKDKTAELENKARDEASKDARDKADRMAKNIGFKLGKVKSVEDGSGFGVMPYMTSSDVKTESTVTSSGTISGSSLIVQPGENEITYSVNVTYYLK